MLQDGFQAHSQAAASRALAGVVAAGNDTVRLEVVEGIFSEAAIAAARARTALISIYKYGERTCRLWSHVDELQGYLFLKRSVIRRRALEVGAQTLVAHEGSSPQQEQVSCGDSRTVMLCTMHRRSLKASVEPNAQQQPQSDCNIQFEGGHDGV